TGPAAAVAPAKSKPKPAKASAAKSSESSAVQADGAPGSSASFAAAESDDAQPASGKVDLANASGSSAKISPPLVGSPLPGTSSSAGASGGGTTPTSGSLPVLAVADVVEQFEPCVVRLDVVTPMGDACGSGFIVDSKGTVVTNFHVIEDAKSATATL